MAMVSLPGKNQKTNSKASSSIGSSIAEQSRETRERNASAS